MCHNNVTLVGVFLVFSSLCIVLRFGILMCLMRFTHRKYKTLMNDQTPKQGMGPKFNCKTNENGAKIWEGKCGKNRTKNFSRSFFVCCLFGVYALFSFVNV